MEPQGINPNMLNSLVKTLYEKEFGLVKYYYLEEINTKEKNW